MAEDRKSPEKDKDTAEKRGTERKVPESGSEAQEARRESASRARRAAIVDDGTPTRTEDGGSVNHAVQVADPIPDPNEHRDRLRDQDDSFASTAMAPIPEGDDEEGVSPRRMTEQVTHFTGEQDVLHAMAFPSRRAVEAAEASAPNAERRRELRDEQDEKRGGTRRSGSRKSSDDDKK